MQVGWGGMHRGRGLPGQLSLLLPAWCQASITSKALTLINNSLLPLSPPTCLSYSVYCLVLVSAAV